MSCPVKTFGKIHYGNRLGTAKTKLFIKRSYGIQTAKQPAQNEQIFNKCKEIILDCEKRFNFSQQDWYETDLKGILDERNYRLLDRNFGSTYNIFSKLFPEKEWLPWKFKSSNSPSGYWTDPVNQRKFFDEIGKKYDIKHLDDWYGILSKELVAENGGASLLYEHSSCMHALMANYPEHNWIPWKFHNVARKFWTLENQKAFFEWLGKTLGVKELDDWYSVLTHKVVVDHGGCFLSRGYNSSPAKALMMVYPEHNWLPWKFSVGFHGFWKEQTNQRIFFDWLGKQIGIEKPEDWYKHLSVDVINQHGGSSLITVHFAGSPMAALLAAYPEQRWIPWKFERCSVPKKFWDSQENTSNFVHELSERLCIQTLDDWYRVDVQQLVKFGAIHIFKKHGGLYSLLKRQYPHHPWDPKKFFIGKKTQRWLLVNIKKIFPDDDIVEDYMHPKAVFKSSKRPIQLDAFIPSKSLAFEYQGLQHFSDVSVFQPKQVYQQRDNEKRAACAENNIKLIEIPYWWDRTQQGLEAMIKEQLNPVEK